MKNDDLKIRTMNGEPRTENRERHLVFSFSVLCSPFIILFALLLAQASTQPSAAQVQIVLRYAISSPRDQHVVQYDALIDHLRKVDFQFDPPLEKHADTDREDRSKNYLRGTIAADKFLKVLDNPNVASIMIMPEDFEYPPKDLDKLVRVRLELAGNLGTQRQRELADQVKVVLMAFQFREAVGYDQRGYSGRPFTRLTGTIPQGRLEVLLKDLRGQPAGWFAAHPAGQRAPAPAERQSDPGRTRSDRFRSRRRCRRSATAFGGVSGKNQCRFVGPHQRGRRRPGTGAHRNHLCRLPE